MNRKHWIYSMALLLCVLWISPALHAQVSVGISVGFAPPPLPVYEQPICPGDGYIWTPGYWDWDSDDYYWVPGTWVEAPEVGYLWTPAWWGWSGSAFLFHAGYWGPQVGWYGGISYGFGYFGHGYEGGRWDGGHFFYNRSVNNVNVTIIHNVYEKRIDVRTDNHVSYNGGRGGIEERPTREEEKYSNERHVGPVAAQQQHVQEARSNRELRASVNRGKPAIAATQRPGSFNDRAAVVPAKEAGGRYEPPANRGEAGHGGEAAGHPVVHPSDLPKNERLAAPNTGNPKADQKYQQQQEKMYAKQDQERQKLQQRQDQEHQKLAKQNASDAAKQRVEQRHQQQTQQLQQRHVQQQQRMQQRQAPARSQRGKP